MVYKATNSLENRPAMPITTANNPRNFGASSGCRSGLSGLASALACLGAAGARAKPIAKPGTEAAPQAVPGLLGPAAASGPARSVALDRDPVPDRDRLSAVQFHRPRRQSGRLQCRSGPVAVRRDQGHLHDADAAVRDAARCDHQQPRRRHYRLIGCDAADARAASISPIPITGRRRGSCRGATP